MRKPRQGIKHGVRRIILLAIVACLTFIPLSYVWYINHILPGTYIAGIYVGERTAPEAKKLLEESQQLSIPEDISVTYEGKVYTTTSASLLVKRDDELAVRMAMDVGKKKRGMELLKELFGLVLQDVHIPLNYSVDAGATTRWAEQLASKINTPGEKPSIRLNRPGVANALIVVRGKGGRSVNVDSFAETLTAYLRSSNTATHQPFIIPVEEIIPLSDVETTQAKKRGELFVGKTLQFLADDRSFQWGDQKMISLLSPRSGYDIQTINKEIARWNVLVERPGQEGAISASGKKVTSFTPPRYGRALDTITSKERILSALKTIDGFEKAEIQSPIQLPIVRTNPEKSLAEMNDLGINERIGFAESLYAHSIPNRVYNVGLTAERMNLTLIPPGAVFSYNKAVGEVSAATGFRQAYVIAEGRTVLGDGGGVCQGSTTVFRAALNAGLPIVERKGHAYRVGYYEQNSLPGIDATVYAPSVDFKFKNDTPGYILLTATADLKNLRLVIELWGTSDGRVSTISNHRVYDVTSPKATVYQDDPSLPIGSTKQVDWSAPGTKTSFLYTVTRENKTLQRTTFKTTYQPWAAVYLRGVGLQ